MTPKPVKSRKVSAFVKLDLKRQVLEAKLARVREEAFQRRLSMTGAQLSQAAVLLKELKANAAQAKLSHEAEASVVRVVAPNGRGNP